MKTALIDWATVTFLGGYHVALFVLFPYTLWLQGWSTAWMLSSVILMYLSGMSITAGYHRLFSHKAYQAHPWVEAIFVLFGTLACQGSVVTWSYDHRKHHTHVDEEADPYSASKGFWFSHVLWLFRKRPPVERQMVQDLLRRPLLRAQHQYYPLFLVTCNLALILGLSWWSGNLLAAVTYGFCLRLFMLHHFTWFINSLAHKWGTQNYSREHSAVDNFILSLLTFGEGYHNYHHTFSQDYRNGIKWYHFDPTKWLIWVLSKVGLASNLRRAAEAVIWRKLIEQHKEVLSQRLRALLVPHRDQLQSRLEQVAHSLQEQVGSYAAVLEAYRQAKGAQHREQARRLRREVAAMRTQLRSSWQSWRQTVQEVERMVPHHSA